MLRLLAAPFVAACFPHRQGRSAESWPYRRLYGPLVVFADFPLDTATPLLRELGQLQTDLAGVLGIPATREAIQLYWFAERRTYEAYLARHFPNVPPRRALFIKHRGPGMMLAHVHADFAVDVRHECTHALLHAVLPRVPLWLDEGLAEYFEVPRAERFAGNPHLRAVRDRLRNGSFRELSELEGLQRVSDMQLRDYEDAWAWVHFMLHGPVAARAVLRAYLADLAGGQSAGSLRHRLLERLPELERRVREHFEQDGSSLRKARP